jgi:hypothetical protein
MRELLHNKLGADGLYELHESLSRLGIPSYPVLGTLPPCSNSSDGTDADGVRPGQLYQKVLEYSSFTKMKELASAKGNGKADEHLRKGKVGDWKNHFINPMLLAEYKEKQDKEFEGLPLHYSFEL